LISESVVAKYPDELLDEPVLANAVARHFDTLGQMYFITDEFSKALDAYARARDLRLVDGNVALLAHSEGNLAGASAMLGEWTLAARAFEKVIHQWITLGNVEMVCINRLNLTECLLELCERSESPDLGQAMHAQAGNELDRAEELIEMLDAGSLRAPAAEHRRRWETSQKHGLKVVK
jgi:tetratricopeptide (TPR) repeat protein